VYQHLDAAVVRVAAWQPDQEVGPWPDLIGPGAGLTCWRAWLQRTMQVPGFAAALEQASPVLARRVGQVCDGRAVSEPVARRVVLSVMRYLLRACGRATPFGLFAAAPVSLSSPLPASYTLASHAVSFELR
jgi:hypothetical protein